VDWRTLLQNFIRFEIYDYAFTPPDRRFQDSPFLLPDWNEPREKPESVWFVVDASGSISDADMTAAYSEICGAVEAFGGALEGRLSFFDAAVTEPAPFGTVQELLRLRPQGGGGTSFHSIFRYLAEHLAVWRPRCIIIMTDGYAAFPSESAALGIPVLWLLHNNAVTPPWGKTARTCAA
jgi:predicted metal-dependent peptidase